MDKVALVVGGGGFTGGVYAIGALRALDLLLVQRRVNDLDVFVGTSSGSLIAALCANGVTPEEMMLTATHDRSAPYRDIGVRELLSPNVGEVLRKVVGAPRGLASLALAVARRRTDLSLLEVALALADGLPSGWYTGAGIERYVRRALAAEGRSDDFRELRAELYIAATDLESCERVILGAGDLRDVPISLAVRASTALPLVYAPVRIGNRELVDGGIVSTTNLDVAVHAGAGLVFVVNPIVPFVTPAAPSTGAKPATRPRRPTHRGLARVGHQAFRLLAYQRLHEMARSWQERYPGVDIVLIEPRPDDELMSHTSMMSLSSRIEIARHGFQSVARQVAGEFVGMRAVCARHGVRIAAERLNAALGDASARDVAAHATAATTRT